jgi:hypothetical protein
MWTVLITSLREDLMSDAATKLNELTKKHGAKKEFWDENLKFRYQKKSLSEFTASIFDLPYVEFPDAALTSEPKYLQWCSKMSRGVMPNVRGKKFIDYIRERLAEAEEEDIPPNMEEGIEAGVVILTLLKNAIRNCRDFDQPQDELELKPGEWLFIETAEDSRCGEEVYIKLEGLMAKVSGQVAMGNTETKLTRKDVSKWLLVHGRQCGRTATVNRRRSAYVLPLGIVEIHEVFASRGSYGP